MEKEKPNGWIEKNIESEIKSQDGHPHPQKSCVCCPLVGSIMTAFGVDRLLELVDEGNLDAVFAVVSERGEAVLQLKDEWGLTALHVASATGNEVGA